MAELCQLQLACGIHGLVVLGGTGEYVALSSRERREAVQTVLQAVRGQVPVVVGVLEPGLEDAREAAQEAADMGADAVMVVTPYYVAPAQAGIEAYYTELCRRVRIPIVLYNIPYRTGTSLEPGTAAAIGRKCPAVIGIKECVPDAARALATLEMVGPIMNVMVGEEHLAVDLLAAGAHGLILASSNLIPGLWLRVYELIRAGRIVEAKKQLDRADPLLKLLFSESNPGPLKTALRQAGLPSGTVRLPLLESTVLGEAVQSARARMLPEDGYR
jgi:4-hydroxy-tetrahydrodipicolinate synthase